MRVRPVLRSQRQDLEPGQQDNPEAREIVKHEAGHCPAGRLVIWDKATGKAIEPEFEPSLGLIEDTEKKVSGPIWVRGGIPVVSADGKTYEIRNRLTLCRCGVPPTSHSATGRTRLEFQLAGAFHRGRFNVFAALSNAGSR